MTILKYLSFLLQFLVSVDSELFPMLASSDNTSAVKKGQQQKDESQDFHMHYECWKTIKTTSHKSIGNFEFSRGNY